MSHELRTPLNAIGGYAQLLELGLQGPVTPEQLAVLEAVFAANRSPNAVRRREISEQLGMSERQTQIWFQNRCVGRPHGLTAC